REGFKEAFKPLIKSQDSIKKSSDEQQNTTIAQLKANQLALTQGFEQFNRLADMRELPYDNEEGWDRVWLPESSPSDDVRMLNLEKNFEGRDLELLKEYGFPRPNDFFEINPKVLDLTLDQLKDNIKQLNDRLELLGGSILAGNNGVIPEFSQIAHLLNQMKALATPTNGAHQTKTGHRFVADNTGEATPFDWYNARFSVDFKVNQLAAGANIDADGDQMGIVNGSSSLIEKLSILANGRDVYSCNYANHVVNIKNLLEYNPSYIDSVATNEFYYLDTSRHAERQKFTSRNVTHRRNAANNADDAGLMLDAVVADYNKGFSIRKVLLGDSATVRCEISLNRYSFFESLDDKLLPNTKIELNIELESDGNLIWRAGGNDCRVGNGNEYPDIHFKPATDPARVFRE
ncbi:unnamed protein product, partial [Porites lobata]